MRSTILKMLVILAVLSMSCQLVTGLPNSVETGNLRTFTVDEPAPQGEEEARVRIEMGGGTLDISGGAAGLVEGTVEYNLVDWVPEVTREGGIIRIAQNVRSLPIPRRGDETINRWDLQFGSTPVDLQINAGAYEGTLDLSGVPLTRFVLNSGASNTTIRFDELNPERMSLLELQTGASNVELVGLGNANFSEMRFVGAAGNYSLDFSGDLEETAVVDIEAAIGDLTITVPAGLPIQATINGGLREVDTQGEWDITDNVYTTGQGDPLLIININMSIGNLNLISD